MSKPTREQALQVIAALFSEISVEGCDFYHNEANDYGSVDAKIYVKGNPWRLYAGTEQTARYRGGKVAGTGRYFVNEAFVELLADRVMDQLEK
jgi:hypothetical protein